MFGLFLLNKCIGDERKKRKKKNYHDCALVHRTMENGCLTNWRNDCVVNVKRCGSEGMLVLYVVAINLSEKKIQSS